MVIDGEGWHRGVIGITATRVVERYGRPTLIISRDGENAHGSGRSIPAFHLLNALESCGHLFSRYGGHAHAVGFSLPAAAVPELCRHLDVYARDHLSMSDFEPVLKVETDLPLDCVTPELYQALCRMEPFGVGNPEPTFVARDVRLMAPPQIMKDKHIKLETGPCHLGQRSGRGTERDCKGSDAKMSSRFISFATTQSDLAKINYVQRSGMAHGRTFPAVSVSSRATH